MKPANGRHLSFPFRVGLDGRLASVLTLEEHVRDELVQLLLTNSAERPFIPEFGGGVRRLVFESADQSTTGALAKATITRAISRWLSHRVTLDELLVEISNSTIEITVKYHLTGTEDTRVLKFQRQGG